MTSRAVVVGAGTMGSGIAYVLSKHGFTVDVVDPDSLSRTNCLATVQRISQRAVERGVVSEEESRDVVGRMTIHASLTEIQPRPDLVVEAVPESIDLKRRVLGEAQELEPTLLSSNTSSISINRLAESLSHPESFLGLHFFNPVWSNPLLEIVTGDNTTASAVLDARRLAESIGKEAIVVKDSPGFASSRLGVALGLEAIRMVEDGVASPADIDRAMEIGYRHPMGPLRLTDLVGLDVRLGIARNLEREIGPRFAPPDLLVEMVARGDLGKKSGRGFFNW